MKLFILLCLFILSLNIWAQQQEMKHPRVVELEEKLTAEASKY